jgi:O-antigen/teichoic acid export membrane protein
VDVDDWLRERVMAKSLRKTTFSTLASGLGAFFMSMGVGIITARMLGPNDRGIFGLAAVLPHTVAALVKGGLSQASIYAIRRDKIDPSLVAFHVLLATIVGSVLALVVMFVFKSEAMHLLLKGAPLVCLFFSMLLVPFLLLESYFFGILQAIDHFTIFNRRRLLGAGLSLVAMFVALVVLHGGLIAALLVSAGVTIVLDLWLIVTVHRRCGIRFRWDGGLAGRLLSFGVKSHVQTIATHLHLRADMYLVAALLDPRQVAFYSIATRMAELLFFVPESLGFVVYPKQAGSSLPELQELTARSCRHVLFTTLSAGLVIMLIGPLLIVLWYGRAYAPGGSPLYYLAPAVVMMSLFYMLSRNFTSQNRQGINMVASGMALGGNVVFNLFLIPRMGISGAGLASLLSYSVATAILTYVFVKETGKTLREVFVVRGADLVVYRKLLNDVLGRWRVRSAALRRPAEG